MIRRLGILGWALMMAACSEPGPSPRPGDLAVTVVTDGGDPPLAPYRIRRLGGPTTDLVTLFQSGTAVMKAVAPGRHTVELLDVPANCAATPASAEVTLDGRAAVTSVTFTVNCLATGIEITLTETGLDPDPQVALLLNGTAEAVLPLGGVHEITRLGPGGYAVDLAELAPNCRRTGVSGPIPVTVEALRVSRVELAVHCVATTGVIRVTTWTTGVDRDLTGFLVRLPPSRQQRIGTVDWLDLTLIPPGEHAAELAGVAPNCSVHGPNPRGFRITAGTDVRDTAEVLFEVACVPAWRLAYERAGLVFVGSEDGAVDDTLAIGSSPSWSADGRRVGYECGGALCARTVDQGSLRLSFATLIAVDAVISPDGQRMAFEGQDCRNTGWDYYSYCDPSRLYTVRWDGSGLQQVVLPEPVRASRPAWSPDGTRLAFECRVGSDSDICVAGLDGSGFRQLTSAPGDDVHPAWRADGGRLAFATFAPFATTAEIVTIAATGGTLTRVSPLAIGVHPDWSRDGRRILFSEIRCSSGACGVAGLASIGADGADFVRLPVRGQRARWRP